MLNGGLPAWVAEGLPLDGAPADEAELAAPVLAASSPPADPHFHACLQARARPPPPACCASYRQAPQAAGASHRQPQGQVLAGNAPAGSLPVVAAHSLQFLSQGGHSSVPVSGGPILHVRIDTPPPWGFAIIHGAGRAGFGA